MKTFKKTSAFTLVELLVVIAIIALLLAILMPALNKVRNQAKVLTDAANAKQVGTVMAVYQNDNDQFMPVMLHKFAVNNPGIPAKACLLSLPMHNYSGSKVTLENEGDVLDPEQPWDNSRVLTYSQKYLPKFYICPFVRNTSQASWMKIAGQVKIGTVTLDNYVSDGLSDSYSTWLWPRTKGYKFEKWPNGGHPYGPDHGITKYANMVWHSGGDPVITNIWADQASGWPQIKNKPVKFSESTQRRDGITQPFSERMVAYCIQGQVDESSHSKVINYGSHAKAGKGGTNVMFADLHIEWVPGSQIVAGN